MSFFKKLLGKTNKRNKASDDTEQLDSSESTTEDKTQPPLTKGDTQINPTTRDELPPPSQALGPNSVSNKDLGAPPPPHLASAAGNAGMQAGMIASFAGA